MALNTAALRFDLSVKMYNFWWYNTQILLFIWANWSSSKAGGRKIERQRKKQCKMHDLWVFRGRPPAIRGRAVQICCLESLRGEGASLSFLSPSLHEHTYTCTPLLHKRVCLLACCALDTTHSYDHFTLPLNKLTNRGTNAHTSSPTLYTHANARFT